MKDKFKGIFPALLTPFDRRGEVDIEALKELISFLIDSGVHGLQPLGSTGQGPLLSQDERMKVAETVIEHTPKSTPIIVHVGAIDTGTTVRLARHARDIHADAISCVTPYYYIPDEEAILSHFRRVASATDLPLFIYNIPMYTGYNVTLSTLRRLADIPNLVGIKESNRDFSQILDTLRDGPPKFILLSGPDKFMFSSLVAGAPGCVSAIANATPTLCVAIYDAVRKRNYGLGNRLQSKLDRARQHLENPRISPLFEAIRFMGLKSGFPRSPLRAMSKSEITNLKQGLRTLELIPRVAKA